MKGICRGTPLGAMNRSTCAPLEQDLPEVGRGDVRLAGRQLSRNGLLVLQPLLQGKYGSL